MTNRVRIIAAAALALLSLPWAVQAEEMETSLYDRLGGEPAITAVVDDFVNRAAGDPAVNFTRKGTPKEWEASPENVTMLKKHLTQFVCSATGGPQVYEGKDMKTAHEGMLITAAEFGAIAADLKATLDQFGVPEQEQNELLAIVGTTQGTIVEVAQATPATPAPTETY